MQLKTQHPTDSIAVVSPIGRMDVESSSSVRQVIMDIVEHNTQTIIVNLTQVEFMDSSGLSALVSGMKALRGKGGVLSICNPNAQVRTALRLTMLDRVFPIFDTIDAALEAAGSQSGG